MAEPITKIPNEIVEDNTNTFMHNYAEGFGEMCELSDRIKPINILQAGTINKNIDIPISEYPVYNHNYSNPLIEKVIKGQFNYDGADIKSTTVGNCTLYLITPDNYSDKNGLWIQGETFQYNF